MNDDAELAQIRARRLAEMKSSSGGMTGNPKLPGQGQMAEEENAAQMEEMRKSMLYQILSNEAKERLNRISIVKPAKSRAVEDLLINMARSGQVREKITEKQLIELLESMTSQTKTETTVRFTRRKTDSDEDEWDI